MAQAILIEGPSGSGKSTAARTLDPTKTVIVCPENKPLPFPGAMKDYVTKYLKNGALDLNKSNFLPVNRMVQYNQNLIQTQPGVNEVLVHISDNRPNIKVVLIDTFTYAMVESVMRDIHVDNYKKFNIFAQEFYDLVKNIARLRNDLTVIITAHVDEETDNTGTRRTSFKIPAGKLTKNMIVPEGLFTTVLYSGAMIIEGKNVHYFETVNNGTNTCKSPIGMFPAPLIPNDYRFVLTCFYNYYYGKECPALPNDFAIKQSVEPQKANE